MQPAATVADIMNPKLLYIAERDPLGLARSKILEFGVTAIPVLDEDHMPVGVVSLRDLARRDDERPVASKPVRSLKGSTPIGEGARVLAEQNLHHVVVVDDDGVAIGMVSALDFMRALAGLAPRHPSTFDRY